MEKIVLGFREKLNHYFSQKIDSIGLDVFRIIYSIVLLGDALQLVYFKELALDDFPFLKGANLELKFLLYAWIASLVMLTVGYLTRIATVVNYFLTLVFFAASTSYHYHMFFSYITVNLLILFTPVSENLSVDKYLSREPSASKKVSIFYYHSLIFWGIAIVYFDSIFRKLASPMWLNGLGMWLPASALHVSIFPVQWFLDQELIMKTMGYVTLVFEVVMIFTFWIRRLWPVTFIVGMILHIGILVSFPIPFFALGVCGLYLLFIPVSFWRRYFPVKSDEEPVGNNRKYWILSGVYLILLFYQGYHIIKAPVFRPYFSEKFYKKLDRNLRPSAAVVARYTGVIAHGVFMDWHFENYNHVFGFEAIYDGKTYRIPVSDEAGRPDSYCSGAFFVNWTFRVNSPDVSAPRLSEGFKRYVYFWTRKMNFDPDKTTVRISVKKVENPVNWERGFLERQLQVPWTELATYQAGDLKYELPFTEI
jgi:hypothetical protein